MAWKKEFKTKEGKKIILRDLARQDTALKLKTFYNDLVKERTHVLYETPISLAEERKWLTDTWRSIRKKDAILIIIEQDGRMVGSASANRMKQKNRYNVSLGIALSKDIRRMGIGTVAMQEIIKRVKKTMKPKHICLCVSSANKPGQKLYTKLGFRKVYRLKEWIHHFGEFHDEIFMILKK